MLHNKYVVNRKSLDQICVLEHFEVLWYSKWYQTKRVNLRITGSTFDVSGEIYGQKSFQRYIYDLHIIYSRDIYCNVFSSTAGFFYLQKFLFSNSTIRKRNLPTKDEFHQGSLDSVCSYHYTTELLVIALSFYSKKLSYLFKHKDKKVKAITSVLEKIAGGRSKCSAGEAPDMNGNSSGF